MAHVRFQRSARRLKQRQSDETIVVDPKNKDEGSALVDAALVASPGSGFADMLSRMPDVGEDRDFARV